MNRSARAAAFSALCSCSFPSIAPTQALGPLVVVGGVDAGTGLTMHVVRAGMSMDLK